MKNFQAHQALRDISRYVFKCVFRVVVCSCVSLYAFHKDTGLRLFLYGGFTLVKAKTAKCAFQFWFDDFKETTVVTSQSLGGIYRRMSQRRIYKKYWNSSTVHKKRLVCAVRISIFSFLTSKFIEHAKLRVFFCGRSRSPALLRNSIRTRYLSSSQESASISRHIAAFSILAWNEIRPCVYLLQLNHALPCCFKMSLTYEICYVIMREMCYVITRLIYVYAIKLNNDTCHYKCKNDKHYINKCEI